jgi:hypothetical protein
LKHFLRANRYPLRSKALWSKQGSRGSCQVSLLAEQGSTLRYSAPEQVSGASSSETFRRIQRQLIKAKTSINHSILLSCLGTKRQAVDVKQMHQKGAD